jgi:hypothetical protein
MQNRHPADRLADVRSAIKQLEAEEARLRAFLLEHPQDRTDCSSDSTMLERSPSPDAACARRSRAL